MCVTSPRVLGIVLAGGAGKRLMPLTADRAKPAVPFGGNYRLIDFVLSNMVNGGYHRICVLTQYKSHSLDRHITQTWRLSAMTGDYVTPVPAQQRLGPRWYTGSADAILQSLNLIYDDQPDYVVVFGADHVYRMDPRQMVAQHMESGAAVTVAGIPMPRRDAHEFGVIQVANDGMKIESFLEKPADPPGIPGSPEQSYVSMGNYVFSTDALVDALKADAEDERSVHDMGGNIIPMLTARGEAYVYDFDKNEVPGSTERDHAYWRDVGSLDAYHDAHMDLVSVHPVFNLYNTKWPILSSPPSLPPAKFVEGGTAQDSMVGSGSIIAGARLQSSVISHSVNVLEGSYVEGSVLMPGVVIGQDAVLKNVILDKNVIVPPGAQLGVDLEADRAKYTVSAGGVVVLGKGQEVIP
ncbi:MAG: glucose-1-phosphate adenylyltransferase [Actinomycetia bacterium]|nr:glucose-1-phosphate adenylyltransferase [Actinomycetes bacterium]